MLHLVAALSLGLVLAIPQLGLDSGAWRASYVHLLVLGWATQMIFGVAYWMFPRTEPLDPRAVPWLGWVCFGCLNLGVLVRTLAEPALGGGSVVAIAGAVASAALQLIAVVAFVLIAWSRVRAR